MFSQYYNKHSLHEDFCTITPCHRIQNTDAFVTMTHLGCTQPSTIQRQPQEGLLFSRELAWATEAREEKGQSTPVLLKSDSLILSGQFSP